jgi:hypothetical protein
MQRPAIHPGEILADELAELGIAPAELARQIGVPPNRLSRIIEANGASPARRRCGWATGSRPAPNSGSIFKPPST